MIPYFWVSAEQQNVRPSTNCSDDDDDGDLTFVPAAVAQQQAAVAAPRLQLRNLLCDPAQTEVLPEQRVAAETSEPA